MKKYDWTAEKLQMAKELLQTHTARSVGEVMGVSRNAVLGALYREKVKMDMNLLKIHLTLELENIERDLDNETR